MSPIKSIQYAKGVMLLLAISLFSTTVWAQTAPPIQWKKSFGGTHFESAQSVVNTPDGGFLVTGWVQSKDVDVIGFKGNSDVWLIKLDSNGTMVWQKCLGGPGGEQAHVIKPTSDGNYIIAGNALFNGGDVTGYHSHPHFLATLDAWIVKVDGSGNIIWQSCFGGTTHDVASDIVEAKDGGYVFTGITNSYNGDVSGVHRSPIDSSRADIWLVKLDSAGKLKWQKCYGGIKDESPTGLIATGDGGFIISGTTSSIDGDVNKIHDSADVWVIKADSIGNIQWNKTYGGSGNDGGADIIACIDGGYVFSGSVGSNDKDVTVNNGARDAWIVRIDDTGKILWEKSFGGSNTDGASVILQTQDSGYVFTGMSMSNDKDISVNKGWQDWLVMKIDKQGAMTWEKTFGTISSDHCHGATLAKDGYVLVGTMNDNSGDLLHEHRGSSDWVVIKLKENFKPTGIEETIHTADIKVYPSPTSGLVHIDLPQGYERADIKVYDMMGKMLQVSTTENGVKRMVDLSRFASGTYTIQVIHDGQQQSFKIINQQ